MSPDTLSSVQDKSKAQLRTAVSQKAGSEDSLANEGVQTLKQASASLNQIGGQCMAMYQESLAASLQSGTQVSRLMSDLSKSYMDACGCATTSFAEIGRESLACRTPVDVAQLQKRAIESLTANMMASQKLYTDLYSAYSKAFEPLIARVSDTPERLFRAIAD